MSEIEKIQRYMARTNLDRSPHNRYVMSFGEMLALKEKGESSMMDALLLAFDYGRAKGYRAAKREAKA